MSSSGSILPGGRRAVMIAAGMAAIGVVAILAPRVYDAARRELLISRLEKGDDPEARRELADPRHAARIHRRLRESMNSRLTGPLIDLAAGRRLDPAIRADMFDGFFRPGFTDGSGARTTPLTTSPFFPEGCQVFVSMARSGTTELVDLGEWTGRSYTVRRQSSNGDVVQFVEWFIIGQDRDARLVHQRSTWVIIPPGPAGPFRVETEDLTDSPDPMTFFLGRPVPGHEPETGGAGTVLTLGVFGSWRQFFPRLPLLEQPLCYSIHLDRPGQVEGPLHLGWFEASQEVSSTRWRRRWWSATGPEGPLGTPAIFVPASAARLEPFQKLKLLFRPAPEFAARHGITAAEVDSPPFERELYLPPAER